MAEGIQPARMIGQALMLYANDNKGQYPPTLDPLLTEVDITSEVFICPSSHQHKKATGPTTQQIAQDFGTGPNHCSYVYLAGHIPTPSLTPAHVIAHDLLPNHNKRGINVFYGDGSVQWLDKPDALYLLSKLQSGHNPPRY